MSPSCAVLPSQLDGGTTCDLRRVHGKAAWSSFSPAQPLRHSFPPTRPTDCEQSISQRRALCPGEHRHINDPSKLARFSLWGGGAGLISYCALGRAPTI